MSVAIIAEIGSNAVCTGEREHALQLIREAARAGANVVKFQLWVPDLMYRPGTGEYQAAVRWQLPRDWIPDLKAECDANGVEFLCSAFDTNSLDFVDPYVKRHKIASIEATWMPYIEAVNAKRKPVLLSVGMMTAAELRASVAMFSGISVTVLQCVVSYPARIEDYNLNVLGVAHHDYFRGVSDHTADPLIIPIMATALGATVIEKHIRGLFCDSPDAPHAINDRDFGKMVRAVRDAEKALGSGEKTVLESERPYLKYRRSVQGLRGA